MSIQSIFIYLNKFTRSLRGSGTTTLIKKVASENDVWVLVPDQKTKEQFGESGITFQELLKADGFKPKPILLDNYTLIQLSELSIAEFEKLDAAIRRRNELLISIRDQISRFEKNYGEL